MKRVRGRSRSRSSRRLKRTMCVRGKIVDRSFRVVMQWLTTFTDTSKPTVTSCAAMKASNMLHRLVSKLMSLNHSESTPVTFLFSRN